MVRCWVRRSVFPSLGLIYLLDYVNTVLMNNIALEQTNFHYCIYEMVRR